MNCPFASPVLFVLQSFVTIMVLSGMALMPPTAGAMLLLPATGRTTGDIVNIVRDNGGVIVGSTRWGLVVRGSRERLARPLLASGVVPVAASDVECAQ